ncbi:hypothetical protein N7492_007990 [Penicillium capsulatum]|uniref:Glycosyl transferase CAP10 domain-containing protein n=1 Tax=Penicillium capsulatum TaxID=69766 RepID=A0A9W9LGN3_9EURO|nr:hypothetical protein N7492_007990 [Penicillium capsulatum]KAJ6105397.1 hypothetical protein N7512_008914 [Penicillium capsulatum]
MLGSRPSPRVLIALVFILAVSFLLLQNRPTVSSAISTPADVWSSHKTTWEFTTARDADNLGLSEEQCLAAFPKLYTELDKSASLRKGDPITFEDVNSRVMLEGMGRLLIDQGQLFVVDYFETPNQQTRARATLSAIQRALVAFPDRHLLPTIEFFIDENDNPDQPEGRKVIWAYTKRDPFNAVWLMPDFGFWAWPEARIGSYGDARRRIAAGDTLSFEKKIPKLVWRGLPNAYQPRLDLIEQSKARNWSDVGIFIFGDETTEDKYLRIEDHCRYMFMAHTEGASYSGRGKYLLNCRSVLISHSLTWREIHHAAFIPDGPDANYVEVATDFSDLPEKMEFLLSHPDIAERIANNSAKTFRDRYMTPAAEACYWREMIRRYAKVQGFKPEPRGISFEDWILTFRKDI